MTSDKVYISWLEERCARLETELSEERKRHLETLQSTIESLNKLK